MTNVPTDQISPEVAAFLAGASKQTASITRGSVVFAIDATASRQPTWDLASHCRARCFVKSQLTDRLM